jgi:hypothetical protein
MKSAGDVHRQLLLDPWQRPQHLVLLGLELDVDIERGRRQPSRTAVAPPVR